MPHFCFGIHHNLLDKRSGIVVPSDNHGYAAVMLRQAKLLEAGVCAEIAPLFAMSREARDDGADDMDTDGVSLSASDRDGDDGTAASAEQQSEALGRGRRNLARSRSRGESDDEADLGALLFLPNSSSCILFLRPSLQGRTGAGYLDKIERPSPGERIIFGYGVLLQ